MVPRFSEDPKENLSYAANQLQTIFSPGTSKTKGVPDHEIIAVL